MYRDVIESAVTDFLAPHHPPAIRVCAVTAMRLPGMNLPSDDAARLTDLTEYLGPQVLQRRGGEDCPPDEAIRQAALERADHLDELIGKPGHGFRAG